MLLLFLGVGLGYLRGFFNATPVEVFNKAAHPGHVVAFVRALFHGNFRV